MALVYRYYNRELKFTHSWPSLVKDPTGTGSRLNRNISIIKFSSSLIVHLYTTTVTVLYIYNDHESRKLLLFAHDFSYSCFEVKKISFTFSFLSTEREKLTKTFETHEFLIRGKLFNFTFFKFSCYGII